MKKRQIPAKLFQCFLLIISVFGFTSTNGIAVENSSFTGTWTASGERQLLEMGSKRRCAIFTLEGHVNLQDSIGETGDYWSKCIGLSDSESGSQVRCVWKARDGHEIFVLLQGERLEQQTFVKGEIVGGTGKAEGVTGTLSFTWSTLSFHKENTSTQIGGFAKELKGQYQLP